MQEHIARLYQGARAIGMDLHASLSPQQLQALVYTTVDSNGMRDASGVHIRLMVTRGLKPTPYQNPNTTIGEPTVVILPEWKEASTTPKQEVCLGLRPQTDRRNAQACRMVCCAHQSACTSIHTCWPVLQT